MPNFLSPRFSTLRRTLMASTRMTSTASTSRLNSSNSNTFLSHHHHNLNPPIKLPPHYCFRPRFDVGVGLSSSSMRSNTYCTASQNKPHPDSDLWNIEKGWNVPWSLRTTLQTVAIAKISFIMTFYLPSRAFEYFAPFGPYAYGIIYLGICSISASSLFAVILFVTRSYQQQLPKDLFYWDLKDPFNLRKGWLLWTLIALAYLYAQFQLISHRQIRKITEEDQDLWWYALLKCTNFSALCVFVCLSIIDPVAKEVLHCGFLLASLTKWVPTPVAVWISSVVSAIAHGSPNKYIIGLIQGISYVQTRNLLTPIAINCLYNTAISSYYYMSK